MTLGGLPILCDVFVVVVVLVRLFAWADRLADRIGARLHHRRSSGRCASSSPSSLGVCLPPTPLRRS